MVDQLVIKVTNKLKDSVLPGLMEEINLENQALEDRLLKKLVVALNTSLVPIIKEQGIHVLNGYDSIVNIIKHLEVRVHNVENMLGFVHPSEREATAQRLRESKVGEPSTRAEEHLEDSSPIHYSPTILETSPVPHT